MNHVKKILVGIDFSVASENALSFAYSLAGELGASIKVIHVYGTSFKPNTFAQPINTSSRSDFYNQKLTDLINRLPLHPIGATLTNVQIDRVTAHGFTVPQIIKAANSERSDLIVIGNSVREHDKDRNPSSRATIIAQKAICPVLIVPKSYTYSSFQNILYASGTNTTSEQIIQRNIAFANTFRAAMHFVHVKRTYKKEDSEIQNDIFKILIKNIKSYTAFKLATLPPASICESLLEYAKKNKIDLIVLINQKEQFIDNILNHSITQKMSAMSSLPTLVYQQ